MRDFTPEEKELIVNTHITMDCFDKWNDYSYEEVKLEHYSDTKYKNYIMLLYPTSLMESIIRNCEVLRRKYVETKDEHYFDILIHLLPNSYKVVKL